jgi:hypothetical protein
VASADFSCKKLSYLTDMCELYRAYPKNLSTNVKWMTPIRIYLQTLT